MMLGTILPLLLMYMETSITTITTISADPHRKHSVILDYETSVQLPSSAWGEMAKDAVWKEFTNLMGTVRQIEKILQMKYETDASPQLMAVANGARLDDRVVDGMAMGDMVSGVERGDGGRGKTSIETPLCITMLNMIRGMARRVQVMMKH